MSIHQIRSRVILRKHTTLFVKKRTDSVRFSQAEWCFLGKTLEVELIVYTILCEFRIRIYYFGIQHWHTIIVRFYSEMVHLSYQYHKKSLTKIVTAPYTKNERDFFRCTWCAFNSFGTHLSRFFTLLIGRKWSNIVGIETPNFDVNSRVVWDVSLSTMAFN